MATDPLAEYGLTLEDLPEWMRPRQHHWDWSLLMVLVLCGGLLLPLVVRGGIPASQVAQLDYYRIAEAAQNVQKGDAFPQWSQTFNRGYGSPVLLYIAPFPHLLGAWHNTLAQTSSLASFRFVLALGLCLNAVSLLLLVRRYRGEAAGALATALFLGIYALFPYFELGIYLAYGCWLASLLVADRLLREQRGWDICLLGILVAATVLAENTLGILLIVALGGWVAFRVWQRQTVENLKWVLVSIGLGIALTTFYVVPAYSERELVTWHATHPTSDLWTPFGGFAGLQIGDLIFGVILAGAIAGGIVLQRFFQRFKIIIIGALVLVYIFNGATEDVRTHIEESSQFETRHNIYSTLPGGYLIPRGVTTYPPTQDVHDILPLSKDIEISLIENKTSPTHYEFSATTEKQTPMTLNTYYSEYWRIKVDDVEVPTRSSAGLLQFDLPVGRKNLNMERSFQTQFFTGFHRVEIKFDLHVNFLSDPRYVEIDFVSSLTRRWSFRVSTMVLVMLILVSYGLERENRRYKGERP